MKLRFACNKQLVLAFVDSEGGSAISGGHGIMVESFSGVFSTYQSRPLTASLLYLPFSFSNSASAIPTT